MTPSADLHVVHTGSGPPILLMHGGGEDAALLAPQAEALAERGFTAITYDRRGTGKSSRERWPDRGVPRHVEDAADLIRASSADPVRVLGFSSGGVLALALASSHPDLVTEAIAWEPAAVRVLPDADQLHELIMAPVRAHLEAHPKDWSGAYDLMLMAISGGTADLHDPIVEAMRRNAEAAVRDDAEIITRHRFCGDDLAAAPAIVAVGAATSELHAAIAERLAELSGRPTWTVPGISDHEVYLNQPEVLADAVRSRS